MKVTVFTPAYNRRHLLNRLFDSLLNQTSFDFEWVVVDDGSSDHTDEFFSELNEAEIPFPVLYYQKENGGKCSAINKGVELAKGEWFFIVDSDDYLYPDAIETIIEGTYGVDKDNRFGAICYLKCLETGECVGGEVDYETLDSDFFNYRAKLHYYGDRAEVIKTAIMKQFPFPVYDGEKIISEATVWNRIAKKYKCRYYNKKIYKCEYQIGGLSDSSSRLFNNSPKGSMLFYKENYFNETTLLNKTIAVLMYWRFRFSTSIKGFSELRPTPSMYIFLPLYPIYLLIRYIDHKRRKNLVQKLNSSNHE